MSKFRTMLTFLLLGNLGCASERLYVKVVDDEGNPVTNGVVHVGFSTSHVLFGGGNSRRSKSGRAEGRTDKEGAAVVKFNCQSSDFGWHVEADGYYRSEFHKEHFKMAQVSRKQTCIPLRRETIDITCHKTEKGLKRPFLEEHSIPCQMSMLRVGFPFDPLLSS